MFKQAIIYYPADKKILKQINKDIAALHCTAAAKYMDTMKFTDDQKATIIDNIISDLAGGQKASA